MITVMRFVLSLGLFAASAAAAPIVGAEAFFRQNCIGCHGASGAKAGLDLTKLAFEPENFATWVKVYDRVADGEMPPKGLPRPAAASMSAFLKQVSNSLVETEIATVARNGRAGLRRLNAYEYENAIRDLLGVPWLRIRDKLPQDGIAFRFNKTGTALDVSHVQMARYMSTAQMAMREAMAAKLVQPATATTRVYARQEPMLTGNMWPREGNTRTDRMNFPVLDSHAQPEVRAGRSPITSPETKEREAMGRVSSIFSDAGGFSWTGFRVPAAGRYKIRVKGYSIWVSGGGIDHWNFTGFGPEKTAYLYTPRMERPNADEVWPGRRNEPIGVYAQSSGQSRPLGEFDFKPEAGEYELDVALAANEMIQTDSMRLFRTRVNGTELEYVNPLATKEGMPGVAFQWLEVTGPLYDASSGEGYRNLFGDLPLRRMEAGGVGVPVVAPRVTGENAGFRNRIPRMVDVNVEVETKEPKADAQRLLRAFLSRAYRGPVDEGAVQRFMQLFEQQMAAGNGFAKSMLFTYTAVLSSPGFLFVQESPGKLSDDALATRLALFLWNSPPDAELRGLAAAKKLQNAQVLRAQTERMLKDARSQRFIEAFTDYWLDIRKIDDSSPSTTLYNDYELDDPLKLAAIEETRLFVNEMVKQNLPARNVIQSDFTFLNERLARHYGVPGVTGASMRKVALPKDSVRGGLMTQASVLKVTANGTTTSPVLRGVWIMERILGYQTAPPPGVPAVEPDIRGAVTIRQQLDKHRADASCASCHRKIDPPGFALESFDVMGGWREKYRATVETVKPEPGVGFSGQRFAFHYALPVDSAGTLESGAKFSDIREFKKVLLEREEKTVARNLAQQLLIYSTGAPIGFADRKRVDEILEQTRGAGYGVRSMIHGIVQSQLFQNK